jgi:alpha-galactosidase
MRRTPNPLGLVLGALLLLAACEKGATPVATVKSIPPASQVKVAVNPGGGVGIVTSAAEFTLTPAGYLQAVLLSAGKRWTLDDPADQASGQTVVVDGKTVRDLVFDWANIAVANAAGKFGPLGKRVEVKGKSAATGIEETIAIEVYDNFPGVAILSSSFKNAGAKDVKLSSISLQEHRLNASLGQAGAAPNDLWSFQGASYDWGQDEVLRIPARFSRPNLMGAVVKSGAGGGIPVNAFWTANVGEAMGHVETIPLQVSLPVQVDSGQRIQTALTMDGPGTLKAGESFATPRSFVAIYRGDFYEPLRTWSLALQKEGWTIAKPNREDFNIAWCGWGYEFNVTPAQMLGTIPKLKELGISWATLDDRWFTTYGDWDPRPETFPGDSIRKMVDGFHQQGIHPQIWWYPLTAEDGNGKWESHRYVVSKVVQQHPDWLVLDKAGKPARVFRGLATLCPALPEVQAYYKQLTEKFIRDWDFDGHKLDNVYTVPACYNPKHHHQSPEDSTRAMADVYKIIFQTTRALKPESVTQICPCGTMPNLAWLPFMDQAVTADPVGGVQVRRRIKVYKAVLGPMAAVYGDHVELSEMKKDKAGQWSEYGRDFSSTLGTGGVLGTKFTWPADNPKFSKVNLNPDREEHWKKWTTLYNAKMLSQGEFRNLYVYGYDLPEAYAIEKDGRMYYAFYAADAQTAWKGKVELRGLSAGNYTVHDYVNGRDLGQVDAAHPQIETEFKGSLLVEAIRKP